MDHPVLPQKKGRPTGYSVAVEEAVLLGLAEGKTLNSIVRSKQKKDSGFPSAVTIRKWALNDVDGQAPGFSNRYARARDLMLDAMLDDTIDIADDESKDLISQEIGKGGRKRVVSISNPANVQRSRLKIDVRKWLLSKLKPERYGNRIEPGTGVSSPLADLLKSINTTLPFVPSTDRSQWLSYPDDG